MIFEDGVHAVPFIAVGLYADGELGVVLFAGVILVEGGLEEPAQIFVFRDASDGGVDGVDVAVDAFFSPEHPDFFVEFVVEEFAVVAAQKVIGDEDFGRRVELVFKRHEIGDVFGERKGHEIEIGVGVVFSDAFLSERSGGRFAFDAGAKEDAVFPGKGFGDGYARVGVAAAVDHGA